MLVINSRAGRPVLARLRRALAPLVVLASFAVGGLSGAYLVHDGAAREWVKLSFFRVANAGNYLRALGTSDSLPSLRFEFSEGRRAELEASRRQAISRGVLCGMRRTGSTPAWNSTEPPSPSRCVSRDF